MYLKNWLSSLGLLFLLTTAHSARLSGPFATADIKSDSVDTSTITVIVVTITGTSTIQGNAFSVGGSTLSVNAGLIGLGMIAINRLDVLGLSNVDADNIARFLALNQSQGIGIGFNTLRAIGTNANINLHLEPKGDGFLHLHSPVAIGQGTNSAYEIFIGELVGDTTAQGRLNNTGSGDVGWEYTLPNVPVSWMQGVDQSDGNKWKISHLAGVGALLGTGNDKLVLTTDADLSEIRDFTASREIQANALTLSTQAVVTITADNQVLTVGTSSYIRLTSDDATNTNRTFCLTDGIRGGQFLILEWTDGTNEGQLQDEALPCASGTTPQIDGDWPAANNQLNDTLRLNWNGTAWVELSRSAN